ncbi:UNVERIFIED_CONTAM: hypothetical protein FKN15_046641 [Acipenser sinensis]
MEPFNCKTVPVKALPSQDSRKDPELLGGRDFESNSSSKAATPGLCLKLNQDGILPENRPKTRKQAASESTTTSNETEAQLEDCRKTYSDCYQTNQSGSVVHLNPAYLKDSAKRTERTGAVVDPILRTEDFVAAVCGFYRELKALFLPSLIQCRIEDFVAERRVFVLDTSTD